MVNIRTFDLNLLRIFDALAVHRRVALAADHLGLSQPTVSNALARMRRITGDPLFVRTRNGMEPTPYAQQLARPLQAGLNLILSGLEQSLSFDPLSSPRLFTMLVTDVGEVVFLPGLLGALRAAAPKVQIRVLEVTRQNFPQFLEDGSADLALGLLPPTSANYRSTFLFTNRFAVLYRTGHPIIAAAGPGPVSRQTYEAVQHISISPPSVLVDIVESALRELGIERRVMTFLSHFVAVPDIVALTDLVATVPQKFAASLRAPGTSWAELAFPIPAASVAQWWHLRQDADPGHRWLRNMVERLFKDGNDPGYDGSSPDYG